jgi:uncharacterized protein
MGLSRRDLLGLVGLGATGTILASSLRKFYAPATQAKSLTVNRFDKLQPDPQGILDLLPGFQYKIISAVGETMDDGLLVPNHHDGMGAIKGKNGTSILIRNHELSPLQGGNNLSAKIPQYDSNCPGCTTTLIIDRDRNLKKHFLSLAGTNRNCSGGVTTWNSWISCEEEISTPYPPPGYTMEQVLPYWGQVKQKHGYNFEVTATETIVSPQPLIAMGRFRHEAIAIDPKTGYIYQTEDRVDGCFYRFRPHKPGKLRAGGILEALKVQNMPTIDTGLNFPLNEAISIEWVEIEDVDPQHDTLRYEAQTKGAAIFRRGEGMCYSNGEIYFTCTNGGKAQLGQIFRYNPFKETLELFLESLATDVLDYPDNLTVAPFGDLIVCEDGRGEQRLMGITPEGQSYQLARNALNNSEFAGVCFAPDGKTMFVNIYHPGMTLAVWNNNEE